jgi:hypothetical protein
MLMLPLYFIADFRRCLCRRFRCCRDAVFFDAMPPITLYFCCRLPLMLLRCAMLPYAAATPY